MLLNLIKIAKKKMNKEENVKINSKIRQYLYFLIAKIYQSKYRWRYQIFFSVWIFYDRIKNVPHLSLSQSIRQQSLRDINYCLLQ